MPRLTPNAGRVTACLSHPVPLSSSLQGSLIRRRRRGGPWHRPPPRPGNTARCHRTRGPDARAVEPPSPGPCAARAPAWHGQAAQAQQPQAPWESALRGRVVAGQKQREPGVSPAGEQQVSPAHQDGSGRPSDCADARPAVACPEEISAWAGSLCRGSPGVAARVPRRMLRHGQVPAPPPAAAPVPHMPSPCIASSVPNPGNLRSRD